MNSIYNTKDLGDSQSNFSPTWLYIKQHNKTGLKYFGKTSGKNPKKYKGSGIRWNKHLKKYGNDVSTIWCELFINKEELIEFAINFSINNNIVNSKEWANLKIENGLDGNPKGILLSENHKKKIGEANKGKNKGRESPTKGLKYGTESKLKMSAWQKGIPKSKNAKIKMSLAKKGKPKVKVCRLIDQKVMDISNFIGWCRKN